MAFLFEGWLKKDGGKAGYGKPRYCSLKFGNDVFTLDYYEDQEKQNRKGTFIIARNSNFTKITESSDKTARYTSFSLARLTNFVELPDAEFVFGVDVSLSGSASRKSGSQVVFSTTSEDSFKLWEMAFATAKPPSLGTHNEDVDFKNQILIREGWLLKDGGRIGSGKDRFCVLKFGGELFSLDYYDNAAKKGLKGTLVFNRFANFSELPNGENMFSLDVTFSTSGSRQAGGKVVFRAPSSESFERWEKAFATAAPCLDPVDTSQLNAQEREGHALKESAKRVLGYGYNRPTLSLQERAWAVASADIDISAEKHIQAQTYGTDELSTVNELNKKTGVRLAVSPHLPGVMASISGAVGSNSSSSTHTKSIVCTYVHFKEAFCKLNKLPSGSEYKEVGDAFVKAAHITAGFQVRILVEETSVSTADGTDLSGKIALGSVTMGGVEVFSERFQQTVNSSTNVKITMWAEGTGGFDASIKPIAENVAEVVRELVSLDERFRRELPDLHRRQFTVQPTCGTASIESDLGNYSELYVGGGGRHAGGGGGSIAEVSLPVKAAIKYSALDTDAMASLERHLTQGQFVPTFPDVAEYRLYTFLGAINSILVPTAVQVQKPISAALRTVYVIGMSGKGKSTLLGYLMGHSMKMKNGTLEYADGIEDDPDRPYIGHRASQTKGCTVYNKDKDTTKDQEFEFIDCAGTLDTAGPENDICNAIAMSMMSQKRPPVALLVVIDMHCFSDRGIVFLKLIERIIKAFKGHDLAEVLPSIVFIINDKKPDRVDEFCPDTGDLLRSRFKTPAEVNKDVMDAIEKSIEIKKMERSKILQAAGVLDVSGGMKSMANMGSSVVSAARSTTSKFSAGATKRNDSHAQPDSIPPNSLHEAEISRLELIQADLFVLKSLRKLPRNFIAGSMTDKGQFRESVSSVLRGPGCKLAPGIFNAACIYEETVSNLPDKILAFTCGASRFLSTLFSQLVELKEDANDHTSHMMNLTTHIEELKTGKADAGDHVKAINSSIAITAERLAAKTAEQEELRKKIATLSADESRAKICTVRSKTTIRMRTRFAVADRIATKYNFEYVTPMASDGRIPILAYEVYAGAGKFDISHPGKGHITAIFTPCWFKREADLNAHIEVFVENRHLPSTVEAIANLTADINERQAKLNELNVQLQAYKDSAESAKRISTMKLDAQIQALDEKVETHKNALNKSATEITAICAKLDSWMSMCKVLAVIIESLNYCRTAHSSDKDTCQKLVDFVRGHSFGAPTCHNAGHTMWKATVRHLHGVQLCCNKCRAKIVAKQVHWTCRACGEDNCMNCV